MAGLLKPMHLLVILAIVLIIFGPGRLSELGSSLGKAIKGFKKSVDGKDDTPGSNADLKKIDQN